MATTKDFEFTAKQREQFRAAIKEAQQAMILKGEHRIAVAEIVLDLHKRILKDTGYDTTAGKLLREMFATELGVSRKVIEVWIDVKNLIYDKLPQEEVVPHSYTVLNEAMALVKRERITAKQALAEVTESETEHKKRIKLLLRYSAELLTSCRKYRGKSNTEIVEIRHRLKECLKILP